MLDLLIRALSHLLIPMFLLGMAGSAVIIVVTLARDLTDFLSDGGTEEVSRETLN